MNGYGSNVEKEDVPDMIYYSNFALSDEYITTTR